MLLIIVRDKLWRTIGRYQHGFREGHSTLSCITSVLSALGLSKRGRKLSKAFIFVDFKRAFDTVDRTLLLKILSERLKDPALMELLKRYLLP